MALSDPPKSSPRGQPAASDLIAVALRYQHMQGGAPTVVASGRGELAQRIVSKAEESGVPIRRNADLAQALSLVELGEQIPLEAYAAVAEIIAYLLRLDGTLPGKTSRAGAPTREESR